MPVILESQDLLLLFLRVKLIPFNQGNQHARNRDVLHRN
jgi:hypothetical protein